MQALETVRIGKRIVGRGYPAYIIAEIGSNFDGDLGRAKRLAQLAKEAGADAYKIQNFLAPKIVSSEGFKNLKASFQSSWDKPVVDVYRSAEFPREWVAEVAAYCDSIGIDFLSSPYDHGAVDLLERIGVPAHKIGSGEIDNLDFLEYVAKTGKPLILACGSATLEDVATAVEAVRRNGNGSIVLLQCVTNYPSPIGDANLRAMVTLSDTFGVPVGYSDHTIGTIGGGDDPLNGITVPLGAIALGGCMIEKHVTDDRTRKGPDHPFALEFEDLKRMVDAIRAMERALGDGIKRVMESERETVIIQRRGIYAARGIRKGEQITRDMLEYLRPAVALRPPEVGKILGKRAVRDISAGSPMYADAVS